MAHGAASACGNDPQRWHNGSETRKQFARYSCQYGFSRPSWFVPSLAVSTSYTQCDMFSNLAILALLHV
jgi:hypothetical protein